MKVFLMYRDRDFDATLNLSWREQERELLKKLPWNHDALTQDLELETLFSAMARGDVFLHAVARQAVLTWLTDPDAIRYRQDILRDCLEHGEVIRQIYQIPIEASQKKQKHWLGIFGRTPSGILAEGVEMLEMLVGQLKKLRLIADGHGQSFVSEGFRRFFAAIVQELSDDYFAVVDEHLRELHFRRGMLMSAVLGQGLQGADYALRKPNGSRKGLLQRLTESRAPSYTFSLDPRDEGGASILADLRNRGANVAANAVAQAADHIDDFFDMLRLELAFYVGCLNLSQRLAELAEPIVFPVPAPTRERRHTFTGLYDVCLALTMKQRVVGNDVQADDKVVAIITGANQGGKSVFLRSVGLAQLMMQCGMFVPAESFSANACSGVFTHFRREEDKTLTSGKLDEELGRMSNIVDHLAADGLVLFSESFAATNEREGSEIARQVVGAVLEKHIKVFFVTHQYEFAHNMAVQRARDAIFLRAERLPDGTRTFKLIEGEPLQTSYGKDLYDTTFGTSGQAFAAPGRSVGAEEQGE